MFKDYDDKILGVSIIISNTCSARPMFNLKHFRTYMVTVVKHIFDVWLLLLCYSFISAIGLLGLPSETYTHGSMYSLTAISFIFLTPAVAFLYLPVFWDLNVSRLTLSLLSASFLRKINHFSLNSASNFTHEFLYDNFNKKI